MRSKSKPPSVRDRLMSELILCGGEVMTRGDAVQMLQREDVPRGAIDWCAFVVPALSYADITQFARNSLVLALRLRCLARGKEGYENTGNGLYEL